MSKNTVFLNHAPHEITSIKDVSDPYWYSQWIGTLSNGLGISINYSEGLVTVEILNKDNSLKYRYQEMLGSDCPNMISLEEIMVHLTEDVIRFK